MKDVKKVFKNLEDMLRCSSWFNDGWEIYNRGPYLQLYREDWFNQNQGGVHFETFIEANQVRDKDISNRHACRRGLPFPRTICATIHRIEGGRISSWKGYKAVGEGYTICERRLPLNFKNLEQRILEEFNRLRKLEEVYRPPSMNSASKGTKWVSERRVLASMSVISAAVKAGVSAAVEPRRKSVAGRLSSPTSSTSSKRNSAVEWTSSGCWTTRSKAPWSSAIRLKTHR